MIEQNYYQGFTKLCDLNPKMTRIPSKDELERAGCQISGMCYLVGKGGAQYNPSIVSPEIMDDELRRLFTGPALISQPATDIPKLNHTEQEQPIGKYCTQCDMIKSTSLFGKKVGRGGKLKDVCLVCEEANKTNVIDEIIPKQEQQQKEAFTISISPKQDRASGYVSIDRVKALVLEAYEIGKREAQNELPILEPTLNELMGV